MSTTSQRESLFGSALSVYHSGRRRGDSMPEHKHKPKMVMVISIGAKPKKKGEAGVKKSQTVSLQPGGEGCQWVMNTGRRCGLPIVARGPRLCEGHARVIPDSDRDTSRKVPGFEHW